MTVADCRACGATIDWAEVEGTEGENKDNGRRKVPIERGATDTTGPDRYTVVEAGPPMVVRELAVENTNAGFVDHRVDCPDYGAGKTHLGTRYR